VLAYTILFNSGQQQQVLWPDDSLLQAFKAAGEAKQSKFVLIGRGPQGATAVDLCQVAMMHVTDARGEEDTGHTVIRT